MPHVSTKMSVRATRVLASPGSRTAPSRTMTRGTKRLRNRSWERIIGTSELAASWPLIDTDQRSAFSDLMNVHSLQRDVGGGSVEIGFYTLSFMSSERGRLSGPLSPKILY